MEKNIPCPGCGLLIYSGSILEKDFNALTSCRELLFELSYYTLSLKDEDFIHQLIVDTYAAQHSGEKVKPITTLFALIGLFLVNEKHFSGKQVQLAHMALSKKTKNWPHFVVPIEKNWLTVQNV